MHETSRQSRSADLGLAGRSLRAFKRLGCGCLLALLLIFLAFVALITIFLAAGDNETPHPIEPTPTIHLPSEQLDPSSRQVATTAWSDYSPREVAEE